MCEGDPRSGYAALVRPDRSALLVDEPHHRRCDAKRAAEMLVGQWWREKCEREARPFTVADAVALVNEALAAGGVKVTRPDGPVRGFALQYAAVDE
jgi:hypothetical protein